MAKEWRVYGPPGTGKTTYVSRQAMRAADEYGAASVVIASLTRAAAAEVAGRDTGIPERNVGTLHAHAYRALGRPNIAETREGLKLWNEYAEAHSKRLMISDKWSKDYVEGIQLEGDSYDTEGEQLLAELSVLRARMVRPEFFVPKMKRFHHLWSDFKEQANLFDFTDLIELALAEYDRHPSVPMAFFLDEAQDMSALELALARKWGNKCEQFVIVGDPFQNLYEWRGSDPEAFVHDDVAGVKVLSQSYRVPRGVHSYAVKWAKHITSMEFPDYEPRDFDGSVERGKLMLDDPYSLIKAIEEDADAEKTVMVLATCTFMLDPLIAELRERGIPFHNPYRKINGRWNPLRAAHRVESFLRPQWDSQIWTWDDCWAFVEHLQASKVLVRGAKSTIESRLAVRQSWDRMADTEPIPDILQFLNYFKTDDDRSAVFDGNLKWLEENTLASKRGLISYPRKIVEKYGVQALKTKPRVIVGTIHSVKGGEADVVHVFPDVSRAGYTAMRKNMDPTTRQFYVAFTRAREKLVLGEPSGRLPYVQFPAP